MSGCCGFTSFCRNLTSCLPLHIDPNLSSYVSSQGCFSRWSLVMWRPLLPATRFLRLLVFWWVWWTVASASSALSSLRSTWESPTGPWQVWKMQLLKKQLLRMWLFSFQNSLNFFSAGTLTSIIFAVGIVVFGALGYFIRPWRALATVANSSGVLIFLLSVWVQTSISSRHMEKKCLSELIL